MEQINWQVSVHGDRVVLQFPTGDEGGYTFDTSADDARELADAITAAAAECDPS